MKDSEMLKYEENIGSDAGPMDTSNEDFIALKSIIKNHPSNKNELDRLEAQLLSLRFQLESFLAEKTPKETFPLGCLLKESVDSLNVDYIAFANYIGYDINELSKFYSGEKSMNTDLAIKFGQIFSVAPSYFLQVQCKNELLISMRLNSEKYIQYKLEDLLNKAS